MKTTTGKKPAVKKSIPAKTAPAKAGVPMQEIRASAKNIGIPSFGKTKKDLIRTIQRTEGNFDCYATASSGFCDQTACRWHGECIEESIKSAR